MQTRLTNKALLYRFLTEGITRGFSVITLPLLTYYLGVAGYGKFSIAQASVLALVPVVSLGIGFSLVRQIASLTETDDIPKKIGNAFLIVSLPAIALALIIWFAAPFISDLIGGAEAASVGIIHACACLLVVAVWQGVSHEALRARQRTATVSLLQVVEAVGLPAGIISLIWVEALTAENAVWVVVIFKCVTAWAGLSFTLTVRQIWARSTWSLSAVEVRPLLAVGLPFMIAGFGEWLMGLGDRLVIGAVIGAGAAGVYVATQVLVSILSSWGAPFWWVLFPRLCAVADQNGYAAAHDQARTIATLFLKTAVGVAVLLIIVGPAVMQILLGGAAVVDRQFIAILILAVFINQMLTPWEYAIYMERRGALLMRATLLWGGIAIALNFALLPVLGLTGAAVAAFVGRTGFAIQIYRAASHLGYGHELGPDRKSFIVVGMMAGSAFAVMMAAQLSVASAYGEGLVRDLFLGAVFMLAFSLAYVAAALKKV